MLSTYLKVILVVFTTIALFKAVAFVIEVELIVLLPLLRKYIGKVNGIPGYI